MSKCKTCGAEIKFIKMTGGRMNPVDITKRTMIKGEGFDVLISEKGKIIRGRLSSLEDGANAEGYISHFATCNMTGNSRKERS